MSDSRSMYIHPPARRLLSVASLFFGMIVFGSNLFVQLGSWMMAGADRDVFDLASSLAFVAAMSSPFLVVAWACWRAGVELTGPGVVVRLFSTRVIRWGEVSDVRVMADRSGRRVQVRLHDGRIRRLPAPRDQGIFKDRHFDDGFQRLYRSWSAHRA